MQFHLCPIVYGLARPRPVRVPPRANATWRVVEPPRSTVHSAKRPLAPLGPRPRVWAGVSQSLLRKPSGVDFCRALQGKDELFAALPALAKNQGGVGWDGLHTMLIFSEGRRLGDPGLGSWRDDAWDGRKITFSM